MTTLTEQIAGLLAEHDRYEWVGGKGFLCKCGAPIGTSYPDPRLRAHVAAEIAARLAGLAVNETAVTDEAVEAAARAWHEHGPQKASWEAASDSWKHGGLLRMEIALSAALPHMGNGQADAWDEGYEFGYNTGHDDLFDLTLNPYRLSPTGDNP